MKAFTLIFVISFLGVQLLSHSTANESGPSYSIGAGFSPIYVEERVKDNYLIGGLTVLPLYTDLSTGYTINSAYRVALQLGNSWYLDEQTRVVSSGLLAATVTYTPSQFNQVYLFAGAGLAIKNRFSTGEMNQGLGYVFGTGKKVSDKLSLQLSMRHLAFNELVIDPQEGVTEDISSLQLSLVLLTF